MPETTPKLLQLAEVLKLAKEAVELRQDQNQVRVNQKRLSDPCYNPGDIVWLTTHTLSNAAKGYSSKFAPRRDGPYIIIRNHGPTSYEVAALTSPTVPLGVYHSSAISLYKSNSSENDPPDPVRAIRKQGRPKKEALPEISNGTSPMTSSLRKNMGKRRGPRKESVGASNRPANITDSSSRRSRSQRGRL